MNLKNILLSVLILVFVTNFSVAAPVNKIIKTDNKKINNINYCLEHGDYRMADRLIYDSIRSNPGDIQTQILSAISLTMQDKIDSAQDQLDIIKKSALKYADLYYAQGIIYLKRIDTSDMRFRAKNAELIQLAINQFNYSLKINPQSDRVYNALGVANLKLGELFKAQQYFEKAIKINPKYATALDNLGTVYYITNEIDIADKYFKKAESINATSSTVYYHLAQVAFKQNNTQKALYYVNKSLLWNKRSTYAYNLQGEIYKKQGNIAAAITSFRKSIFIMPENTSPYINLASIYESRGDLDAAIEQLKTCYSIAPEDESVILNLADMVLASGQYEDAIKYYSLLSDKYKKESVEGITSAYYSLATESANKAIFRSNKRLSDALVYINQAISESPDNLELYLTKSKLVKLVNNQLESKEILLKIVSAPNSNITDLLTKGDAYISLHQYRDARNVYTQVVKTDKSIDADLYLAEFFTYNKQYRHACDTLDKVLKECPDNQDALNNLAFINKVVSKSEQQYNNAKYFKKHHDKFFQKVYLNKSIRLNPNNVDSNLMLGKILRNEKDYYGANNCFKVVLGSSDNEKQIKKVSKWSKKLDKKIAKIEAKKLNKENNNLKKEKVEKVKPVKLNKSVKSKQSKTTNAKNNDKSLDLKPIKPAIKEEIILDEPLAAPVSKDEFKSVPDSMLKSNPSAKESKKVKENAAVKTEKK